MPVMLGDAAATVDVTGALTEGLTTVANNMSTTITNLLPIVLGVVGAVLAVRFGIRFFRSTAK